MNKYVQDYIEEAQARGYSEREIRSKLIVSGWHPNEVYSVLPVKKKGRTWILGIIKK